eukprot:scaffold267255_cov34-Prasinocladus_malaysianus.AAC.1
MVWGLVFESLNPDVAENEQSVGDVSIVWQLLFIRAPEAAAASAAWLDGQEAKPTGQGESVVLVDVLRVLVRNAVPPDDATDLKACKREKLLGLKHLSDTLRCRQSYVFLQPTQRRVPHFAQ